MRPLLLAPCAVALSTGIGALSLPASELPPIPASRSASPNEAAQREGTKAVDNKAGSNKADDNKDGEAIELGKLRLREGTRLRDVTGRFRQSGDSLTFIDADDREISGLPNLNLERILRMLKTVEEPESISWSVSGSITEFSGRNYLLISRAVYKAAAPPPAPESLALPVEEKKP